MLRFVLMVDDSNKPGAETLLPSEDTSESSVTSNTAMSTSSNEEENNEKVNDPLDLNSLFLLLRTS